MTGARRRIDYVVARGVARALSVGLVVGAFGNLLALGCAFAWLRMAGATAPALWLIAAAALAQFAGGVAALIAYGWSR